MPRTILVGDLHGCRTELELLLDYVGFSRGDRLIAVGDLIVRGPDPTGTLDVLYAAGARAVRGNHEDRVLRAVAGERHVAGEAHRTAIKALRKRDLAWLQTLPLWIDLPEHNLRVVHAGVVPGVPIERQSPRALMYMRCLSPWGEALERRGEGLWGKAYEGSPHIVFGHNALPEPQIHAAATGIDTGAVYGGRLTAMVLRDGESPPPPEARRDVLVSIRSRRRYADR
ncbi:MAG: metallophosphoesterase [Polyangiaceae bacterium]|nr:metallophosphoesterase [Polyangiaceae bacterium]NUQ75697.1 metallophosphoesterase [Polyangiaceae bacterium]